MTNPDPADVPTTVARLDGVRLAKLPELAGNPALEATLRRLQREVDHPREAVSGFSSAV